MLIVNTSNYEGLPVSFMEALSFGIPILAPNVGGIPEIVEHNLNGVLVQARPTAEQVALAIKAIAGLSPNAYRIMRENAYAMWKNKFNAETNYAAFANEIISL
ncbi:MAG: glycosyltransferase [Sphingobacteriales bacterium JAD_PAG50586_3]|nr:MAG: glycosyltransferase [Sphingobacteriales bacterium JAD_PAG50586_3]